MRASFEVFFGSTNSLGGFDVLVGSGLTVETIGSGVGSFGFGFDRVARAIMKYIANCICCVVWRIVYAMLGLRYVQSDLHGSRVASAAQARDPCQSGFGLR
jgi:hypothetical protein